MNDGIFIRMRRTLGDNRREVFVISEDLATVEIKREVEDYLKDPSDTFAHGDLFIEEKTCKIWKSKPLTSKVNIVLAEIWAGCGTSWAFACRNEREIKEALRHVIKVKEEFNILKAKIYREVPVLAVTITNTDGITNADNRIKALMRTMKELT